MSHSRLNRRIERNRLAAHLTATVCHLWAPALLRVVMGGLSALRGARPGGGALRLAPPLTPLRT